LAKLAPDQLVAVEGPVAGYVRSVRPGS
jgi:hypothetical protein